MSVEQLEAYEEQLAAVQTWEEEMAAKHADAIKLLGAKATDVKHIEVLGVAEPPEQVEVAIQSGHEVSLNGYGPTGRHS